MKRSLPLALVCFLLVHFSQAQCTLNNGTGCQCEDGTTNCDLLPDIIMANETLEATGNNGVIEYAQTGAGVENGRLRVSVSTPNIGHGPLTVRSSSIYLCGTDTFTTNPGTCPNGTSPRVLCFQRVYHKTGNGMSFYDRPAGSMTYHPTHQHMHVDDWGTYTLRTKDTTQADPLQWPIIGSGAKLGFCLMDYGTCSYYSGHCVDSLGNTLLNNNFPNFALGGGNYNCDPTEQGISSGYTDIYYQYLDGMYIAIPPGTCNGDYFIVVQIDPHNYFLEEREDNNVIVIPYTLTQQVPAGSGTAVVTPSVPPANLCEGTAVTLTANPGNTYLWSTSDTTQSITVTQPGNYTVQVNSQCGTATSAPVTLTNIANNIASVTDEAACAGSPITLSASGSGTLYWYDSISGGTPVYSGSSYAPSINSPTTYYVESHDTLLGLTGSVGPADNTIGAGNYYSNDQHQLFIAYKTVILKSVKVFANSDKNRTFELRNSAGTVLQTSTQFVSQGTQVITLNWTIAPGAGYQLGWAAGSQPDLYRNSAGASYPYTWSNLVSVTGNSANDLARWYCLYDWQLEEPATTCISNRTPVTATINSLPVVSFTGLGAQYYNTDSAAILNGLPAGGTFSGTGVNGTSFDPAAAGVGGPYAITYQYTDSNGCLASTTSDVSVLLDNSTGVQNIDGVTKVNVYPNPNNGRFELSLKATDNRRVDLAVTNQLGQKVFEEKAVQLNNSFSKNINLGNAAKGIYHLIITSGKKQNTYPVIVE